MEDKVREYKLIMAELQRRIDRELEIENHKRQEQAKRFQGEFAAGKVGKRCR